MSNLVPLIGRDNYTFLRQYILKESGIVVEEGKEYFLSTRLAPVLSREKLPNLDALCAVVRKGASASLRHAIVESVTIHETSFFRDESAFDALKLEMLPRMLASRLPHAKLRIWSAASSSGQEAYSLAMMLLELSIDPHRIEIFATDLSAQIVERAKNGIYSKVEVQRGVANHRMRHFVPHPEGWQISAEIRKMVRFSQMDLRTITHSDSYNLVVCRNVLIYFDMATKLKILKSIIQLMAPDGYLLLGTAESLVNLEVGLDMKLIRNARFYQRRPLKGAEPAVLAAGKSPSELSEHL